MKIKKLTLRSNPSDMNTRVKLTQFEEQLHAIGKSTIGLPPLKRVEDTTLSNRCRVCVRNLPANVKKSDLLNLFNDYGPIKEFLVKEEQHMLVVTLGSRSCASRAVTYLNGIKFDGQVLMVRSFRVPAIKVHNLSKHVTNELLHLAFSIFGKIEQCYVTIDQHGHCCGDGIVEYENKQSMYTAIKFCREHSYFLTSYNVPVIVEQYDPVLHQDGRPESLVKRTPSYYADRRIGPRVSKEGTCIDYYAKRFKELYEEYRNALRDMKDQFVCEQDQLQIECVKIKFDEETAQLKKLIKEREKERKRLDNLRTQNLFKRSNSKNNVKGNRKRRKREYLIMGEKPEEIIPSTPGQTTSGDPGVTMNNENVSAKRPRF